MIMIVGICISIHKLVQTEHDQTHTQASAVVSTAINVEKDMNMLLCEGRTMSETDNKGLKRPRSDIIGGVDFIEKERDRSNHLNRLS